MVYSTPGLNPKSKEISWAQALSPLAQQVQSGLTENRNKQAQIQQNQILGQVFKEIESLGDNASAQNILASLAKGGEKGLSPESQSFALENIHKFEQEKTKRAALEQKEKKSSGTQAIINSLDGMEKLLGKPGIGASGAINQSDKARFNRGEFDAYQAGILPLFKQMFPRMTEKELFLIMERFVPQTGETESRMAGKIKALRLMQKNLEDGSQQDLRQPSVETSSKNVTIKDVQTGQTVPIPAEEWEALSDEDKQGYEIVG